MGRKSGSSILATGSSAGSHRPFYSAKINRQLWAKPRKSSGAKPPLPNAKTTPCAPILNRISPAAMTRKTTRPRFCKPSANKRLPGGSILSRRNMWSFSGCQANRAMISGNLCTLLPMPPVTEKCGWLPSRSARCCIICGTKISRHPKRKKACWWWILAAAPAISHSCSGWKLPMPGAICYSAAASSMTSFSNGFSIKIPVRWRSSSPTVMNILCIGWNAGKSRNCSPKR